MLDIYKRSPFGFVPVFYYEMSTQSITFSHFSEEKCIYTMRCVFDKRTHNI